MIPQTLQGDEDGNPIQVNVINYGNNLAVPVHSKGISTASSSGDGLRLQQDNSAVA